MCLNYIRVKSTSPNGVKYSFVPCGKCADCRRKAARAWKFRLLSELTYLKAKNWNVAFCTLTYADRNLPFIPQSCFKRMADYRPIKCFSREDVNAWICNIRHWLKYHFRFVGDKSLRYFVASELGSETRRPHYHAILAWPPELSYEKMHSVCEYYWQYGYLFPRHYLGDKGMLSFEVVGDYSKVLNYVSKYVCKDLDFVDSISGVELYRNTKVFKNCMPFHLQSRSLGWRYYESLTPADKYRLLSCGQTFLGNTDFLEPLPLYIRNKLVFDNDYVTTPSGKRLVRRRATDFFKTYRKEIFEKRSAFYEELIRESRSESYFIARQVCQDQAKQLVNAIDCSFRRVAIVCDSFAARGCGIGKLYLAYYGVAIDKCHCAMTDDSLVSQWFSRYDESFELETPLIPFSFWSDFQSFCSLVMGANHFCNLCAERQHAEDDALSRRISDYFNKVLGPIVEVK